MATGAFNSNPIIFIFKPSNPPIFKIRLTLSLSSYNQRTVFSGIPGAEDISALSSEAGVEACGCAAAIAV